MGGGNSFIISWKIVDIKGNSCDTFNRRREGMKNITVERFGSLQALISANGSRERNGRNNPNSPRKGFHGVESYSEACELAVSGYMRPVKKMVISTKNIKSVQKKRNVIRNQVVGYAPNVPNAIMGLPTSMINTEAKRMPIKVIRIKYLNAYNSWVSTEDAEEAGTRLLSAVASLENDGYRVEIDCINLTWSNANRNNYAYLATRIKDAQQPIDVKRLAYPLAHPSYFRVLVFRWMETSKCPDLGYGLGKAYSDVEGIEKATELVREVEKDNHVVVLDVQTMVKDKDMDVKESIEKMIRG